MTNPRFDSAGAAAAARRALQTLDSLASEPQALSHEMRIMAAYRLRRIVVEAISNTAPAFLDDVAGAMDNLASHVRAQASVGTHRYVDMSADGGVPERTTRVYEAAWSVFDQANLIRSADLFGRRFAANGISVEFVRDADCLDFGCGTGRNCLALAQLGARSVTGVDLSARNITLARERLRLAPASDIIKFRSGDIYEVFAESRDCYDVIVAQGVIHHMADPQAAFRILGRLLRSGGCAFVYVFGTSGEAMYWRVVDVMRNLLRPVPLEATRNFLDLIGAAPFDTYNVLDFSYVPIQHRFTQSQFEELADAAGLRIAARLERGEVYDAGQRAVLYPWEGEFWGCYDMRCLLDKL